MNLTLDFIERMKTGLVVLRGTGRSGKTATAHWLLRHKWDDLPTVTLAPNPVSDLVVKDFLDVPNDCNLFLDDSALFLHARKFGSKNNVAFSQLLTVFSHKDVRTIVTVQNLALLDISAFMSQDVLILYKSSDWNNLFQEREEYRTSAMIAQLVLEDCPSPVQQYTYSSLGELIQNPLPSHWSEECSKPYRSVDLRTIISS